MSITAKILADSRNPSGSRLTSFLLTYPRFIHAEIMTHRAFSRNAASSRAIPLRRMIEAVQSDPAFPEYWGAEQKGMQSGDQIEGDNLAFVKSNWIDICERAMETADDCGMLNLHKSLCNRLIEPWSHITVLITGSDKGFANFFAQRAHPAAQPEFQVLAYRMLAEYIKSEPRELQWGEWHIPQFQTGIPTHRDPEFWGETEIAIKVATARCARLSYLTFDGEHSPEKDIELHDRLLTSGHFSPFEHCAQAKYENSISNFDCIEIDPKKGNYGLDYVEGRCGWEQYRKQIQGENQTNVDLAAIMATKPEWISLP